MITKLSKNNDRKITLKTKEQQQKVTYKQPPLSYQQKLYKPGESETIFWYFQRVKRLKLLAENTLSSNYSLNVKEK